MKTILRLKKQDECPGHPKSGFTLMEVMVTVSIIGILAAIAVPAYLSYRPKHRLNQAVNEYHSLLQNARMLAIKNRGNCSISFTATSYNLSCTTSGYNKTVNLSDYGGKIELVQHDGTSGVPGSSITFNSRGTCNMGYLHITNSQRQQFYRVGPLVSGVIKKDIYEGAGIWTPL